MADSLDDFFAKKDHRKKSTKSKKFEELAKSSLPDVVVAPKKVVQEEQVRSTLFFLHCNLVKVPTSDSPFVVGLSGVMFHTHTS